MILANDFVKDEDFASSCDLRIFQPPWWLRNGLVSTLHGALWLSRTWENWLTEPEPPAQGKVFLGANSVPLYGEITPSGSTNGAVRGTIVATYGITGSIDNQWFLKVLRRKAAAQGYAVVLFDWRAHGKSAELSPTLTADGLYEGEDFVQIAAQAKAHGCPPPFWFVGYSLGGQLALWAGKAGQDLSVEAQQRGLTPDDIGGSAAICPSLDSERSLTYLVQQPLGRYLERAIAKELRRLAWRIHGFHPQDIDPAAIERATSIWGFDQELVISRLGFATVKDYYTASSALPLLPHLKQPTLILYAMDDPMFHPDLVTELKTMAAVNPAIQLYLTRYGGHVNYFSSQVGQQTWKDPDRWWAWNRVLDWCNAYLNR